MPHRQSNADKKLPVIYIRVINQYFTPNSRHLMPNVSNMTKGVCFSDGYGYLNNKHYGYRVCAVWSAS